MANVIDTDIVLDALCLAVYSDTEETKLLLEKVTELYREAKKKLADGDRDLDVFFEIIGDAIKNGVDPTKKSEKSQIILKVKKSDLGKSDKSIVDSVVNILSEDPTTIKQSKINTLQRRLQQWVFMNRTKDLAKRIAMKCVQFNSSDDLANDQLIADVLEYAGRISGMEEMMSGCSETIDMVDMSNPASVAKAMTAFKQKRRTGVLKTGLKQLNRMLCPNGGFLRGEFAAFAAASHNFKSGMLMKCARWFCTKSDIEVPSGQTPCVVFISLENEIPENSMTMLKEAYIDIYRQPIPEDISEAELVNKVVEYYTTKHIKLLMYRFDSNFSYMDFSKLMTNLKNKGFCVVASIIDYLTQMKVDGGGDGERQWYGIKKLGERFRDYAKRNNMLIVTGLQLAQGATSELETSGRTNVVRQYKPAHLGECKAIKDALDILIFLRIEENQDGVPYLTGAWNKHRDGDRPTRGDQYFAYRFNPVLGLLEDEGTDQDLNVPDIYFDNQTDGSEESTLLSAIGAGKPAEAYALGTT